MNILLLHYAGPPVIGGVESVLAQHARLMADAGHQVCVAAGRGAQFDPRIPFLPVPLADSRHPQVLAAKQVLDTGAVPEEFAGLVRLVRQALTPHLAQADLLVVHNVCSLHLNLPLTAALWEMAEQALPSRWILWHHDLAWATPRYQRELYPAYPWNLLLRDWPHTTHVVVSEQRRQELAGLLHLPQEQVQVIPNGVSYTRFLKLELATLTIASQLDLLSASPLLLLPVRITQRKNIELALEILAALREPFPQARLVVTGPLGAHNPANAAYFSDLLARRRRLGLQRCAHFLAELSEAPLPDAVIADFYRMSDALLLPSREEGFGIPILEAGLAGIPIFCADIPPLRALAGANGQYFSPDGEAGVIAQQISACLCSSPILQLRTQVRTQFTWERIYSEQIAPLLEYSKANHEKTLHT